MKIDRLVLIIASIIALAAVAIYFSVFHLFTLVNSSLLKTDRFFYFYKVEILAN